MTRLFFVFLAALILSNCNKKEPTSVAGGGVETTNSLNADLIMIGKGLAAASPRVDIMKSLDLAGDSSLGKAFTKAGTMADTIGWDNWYDTSVVNNDTLIWFSRERYLDTNKVPYPKGYPISDELNYKQHYYYESIDSLIVGPFQSNRYTMSDIHDSFFYDMLTLKSSIKINSVDSGYGWTIFNNGFDLTIASLKGTSGGKIVASFTSDYNISFDTIAVKHTQELHFTAKKNAYHGILYGEMDTTILAVPNMESLDSMNIDFIQSGDIFRNNDKVGELIYIEKGTGAECVIIMDKDGNEIYNGCK